MHIHIIGICGTFMAGIASVAKAKGHKVTGCDANIYPPMSDVLQDLNIDVIQGYEVPDFDYEVDLYVVGNAAKRGMPIIEAVLSNKKSYISGPEWLYQEVLRHKKVIAISGTHGKTTSSSLLSWVLECAGFNPSFLVGGVPSNFDISARLTDSDWFVIEADEYDTAFFDKRSKMVHYRPDIALVNNLEFDHSDIFDDLKDILKQFHGMLRLVPQNGAIFCPNAQENIDTLIDMGTWSEVIKLGTSTGLRTELIESDGSQFSIYNGEQKLLDISWDLIGMHNVQNSLAVFAICRHLSILPDKIAKAFATFENTKRRMELKKEVNGVAIYDDFAHHPTAIALTIEGLKAKIGNECLLAIIDFGSHTMKRGVLYSDVVRAVERADHVIFFNPPETENIMIPDKIKLSFSLEKLKNHLSNIQGVLHVLVMSNKANQDILESIETTLLF